MNSRTRTALTSQEIAARQKRLRMKDLSVFERNPRILTYTIIGVGLLTFFSKPLYDLFFGEPSLPGSRRINVGGTVVDKNFKILGSK